MIKPLVRAPILFLSLFLGLAVKGEGAALPSLPCPLDRYAWDAPQRFSLPESLREISGLAVLDRYRVLAHDDELGIVSILSVADGRLLGRFSLGPVLPHDDFEGIALLDDVVYLATSGGRLYSAPLGKDGAVVPYRVVDTRLGRLCEIEGLEADSVNDRLLFGCKTPRIRALANKVTVIPWSIDRAAVVDPFIQLPMAAVPEKESKSIRPSAVVLRADGGLLVLSGIGSALLAIGPAGNVQCLQRLGKHHPQPEGLAVMPDGAMVISDEGHGRAPQLTVYRPWRR